ncbi:MAG TPA: pepsin-like aspartyl protease [archaeon]|nr:pepsin-like aspartyl protease [archaeon]
MNLRFNCKNINLGNGIYIKELIVPVTLVGKNNIRLNFTAVLDSGSPFVLISKEIADALELEYDQKEVHKAKSYSGDFFSTTLSHITIKIEKRNEKIQIRCRCAVQLDKQKAHENLIIGSSFFEHFRVLFDYPNNKFEIKG